MYVLRAKPAAGNKKCSPHLPLTWAFVVRADTQWSQASIGGGVGFIGGYTAKRMAVATFKVGLVMFIATQLPTLLHHTGQDEWAAWLEARERTLIAAEKRAESYLSTWFKTPDAAEGLAKQADGAIAQATPWVKKHASLSGGFATGFVLGLQS